MNELPRYETRRVEALADGIFAFAMTLLVLDLKQDFPKGTAFSTLTRMVSHRLFYYLITFIILGVYWTGHHAEFSYIRRTDRAHLWLNILLLMFVAIMPFSTSLLGSDVDQVFAVTMYSCNITTIILAYWVHWQYATTNNRLTNTTITKTVVWDVKRN